MTPTTSIVILVRNALEDTRACVESIRRHTPEPHELVFVDNGSSDGTAEYLAGLDDAFVITNDTNLGFGAGCNQGIAASTGERILLLNNDVVVTRGWLAALHAAVDADPDVALAGPRSNRVAGGQQVDDVGYDQSTLDGLEEWAASWCAAHAGLRSATSRLVGFCILVERRVLDRIGGFDLRYGLGNFEDDDFCLRAVVAGFRCSIAHDSFIHHVGSRTFANEGIDYLATIEANFRQFVDTWQLRPEEYDLAGGSYLPARVIERTAYDERRHLALPVAARDGGGTIELGSDAGHVVAVCCERFDPDATDRLLRAACTRWSGSDDVTVLVRIDPRDTHAPAALDRAADAVGEEHLPGIVVLRAPDDEDSALLRRCDELLVTGRFAWARSLAARHFGTSVTNV